LFSELVLLICYFWI